MSLMLNGDVCSENRFSVRVRRQGFVELGNRTVVDWVTCLFSKGWRALHSILCCPLWIYERQSELVWYSWCDAAVEGLRVAKGLFFSNAAASDAFSNCERRFCSILESPCLACRGILLAFTLHWFEIRAIKSSSWKSLPCLLVFLQLWRRICHQSRTRWWHGVGRCFANDSLRFLESSLTRYSNRRKGMFITFVLKLSSCRMSAKFS